MTGLNTETAEELQVVNYGVGGHYDPHYDFARVCRLFKFNCMDCYLSIYLINLVGRNKCIQIIGNWK